MVVMDIEMPIMDGLTATRAIRELVNGRQVPIVLFTAFDYSEEQAIRVGANSLMRKPILSSALLQTLNNLVSQS